MNEPDPESDNSPETKEPTSCQAVVQQHHDDHPETNPTEKDSYDEFEERMKRIGEKITLLWRYACQEWHDLEFDKRLAHVIQGALLLALIIYTAYTIKMYRATRDAADAAKAATETSQQFEAAHIVVEDFTFEATDSGQGNGKYIDGNFVITNAGQTVATDINVMQESWGGIDPEHPGPTSPLPLPNGPSLPPGKSRKVPAFRIGFGDWNVIERRQWFFGYTISIGYKDIFGRPAIVSDCFMYSTKVKGFTRCPPNER